MKKAQIKKTELKNSKPQKPYGKKTWGRSLLKKPRIKINLHPLAVFGFVVSMLNLPRACFSALAVSALLHECGHLIAAALLGSRPSEITLLPIGISISYRTARSYKAICLVALAGPFLNLIEAAAVPLFPLNADFAAYAKATALSLAAMNLIPLSFFDGGSALRCVIAVRFGMNAADTVARVLDTLVLGFFFLIAVYIFFYSAENASLLILCAYLFAVMIMKNDSAFTR